MPHQDDGLDALRSLFAPATRTVTTTEMPKTRRTMCARCPFGDGLSTAERISAEALKTRLEDNPDTMWGCHETIDDTPLICAGFAKWKADRA